MRVISEHAQRAAGNTHLMHRKLESWLELHEVEAVFRFGEVRFWRAILKPIGLPVLSGGRFLVKIC